MNLPLRDTTKAIVLTLALALLGGCNMQFPSLGNTQAPLADAHAPAPDGAPRPSASLLTTADMQACEKQLGIAPPTSAADAYTMSPADIVKIKDCAFTREKQRMPLLADLISAYRAMLQQGNKACDKDLGTAYAADCLKKNVDSAAAWYDKAVSQRISSDLPGQIPQGGQ